MISWLALLFLIWILLIKSTEGEAADRLIKRRHFEHVAASPSIIASDIADQYRVYHVLEHFLPTPTLLATQQMLQIPAVIQNRLIERLVKQRIVWHMYHNILGQNYDCGDEDYLALSLMIY